MVEKKPIETEHPGKGENRQLFSPKRQGLPRHSETESQMFGQNSRLNLSHKLVDKSPLTKALEKGGEMAQCFSTLAVFPENLLAIHSTDIEANSCLQLQSRRSDTLIWLPRALGMHVHGVQISMQDKHLYT